MYALLDRQSFNRTTLELKLKYSSNTDQTSVPFNRTTLELKFDILGDGYQLNLLLIVPHWN